MLPEGWDIEVVEVHHNQRRMLQAEQLNELSQLLTVQSFSIKNSSQQFPHTAFAWEILSESTPCGCVAQENDWSSNMSQRSDLFLQLEH